MIGEAGTNKGGLIMRYKRHHDDEWFDEIRLIMGSDPILRIITRPRYKTSDLSGDEWRTSAVVQVARGDGHWEDFDRYQNLKAATLGLYPAFYTSHPELHDLPISAISFLRKDQEVYWSTHDGQPQEFLVTAGHLPWAFVLACEAGTYSRELEEPFCFQPGCPNEAVSTYQLKYEYCHWGHKEIPDTERYRRFCLLHLRRGDAGLEDADDNYVVIDGPGPDSAEGWKEFESPAVFSGVIDLSDMVQVT